MIIVNYCVVCVFLLFCVIMFVLNGTLYHSRWECVRDYSQVIIIIIITLLFICDLCIKGDILCELFLSTLLELLRKFLGLYN